MNSVCGGMRESQHCGDLIRRIGLDERDHMNHSIAEMEKLEGRVEA